MSLEGRAAFRAINSLRMSSSLLVSSAHESIYRHSYCASYHVYRMGSEDAGQPLLADEAKVRLATFSPTGDKVAYVRDNNLWVVSLDNGSAPVQLTTTAVGMR